MKKREIEKHFKEGTAVAVSDHVGRNLTMYADKAFIVALGQERDMSTPWKVRSSNDGVRVRFADENAPLGITYRYPILRHDAYQVVFDLETNDRILTSRHVLMPWDEYEKKRDVLQAADNERRRARIDATEALIAAAHALTDLGFEAEATPKGVLIDVEAAKRIAAELGRFSYPTEQQGDRFELDEYDLRAIAADKAEYSNDDRG